MTFLDPAAITNLRKTGNPIGVFDSGLGGLSVLQELAGALPNESFLYLGDVARLPYGTKSAETVARYAPASGVLSGPIGICRGNHSPPPLPASVSARIAARMD